MSEKESNAYDATISTSKDASMAKAMEILIEQLEQQQKERYASIIRPEVNLKKGLIIGVISLVCLIFSIVAAILIAPLLNISKWLLISAVVFVFFVVFCISSKKIIIWSILVYQRYAPAELRLSCCFKPSCSEYMKLAVEKYGVLRGVFKGIKRLFRCHYPNGGEDYP